MPSTFTPGSIRTWVTLLAVLVAVGVGAAIVAEANAAENTKIHCIQEVTPMTEDRAAQGLDSIVGQPECFETEAEALAAAGSVGGGGGGGARFSYFTWYSIFKVWDGTDWTGGSYLYYNTVSCNGYFKVDQMSLAGWNDKASSAAVYCGRDVDLWEHTYLGGSYHRVLNADRTLGALDNKGSSWDTAY